MSLIEKEPLLRVFEAEIEKENNTAHKYALKGAGYYNYHAKYSHGAFCYLQAKKLIEQAPSADVVEIPEGGIGNLSDGYHTFNELYHHRAILFSVICNSMPDKAWKSKLHDTGDMYDGMFIVGIETPEGQATYHYDIEAYWDMFKVRELEKAPKWDGHTPYDAINRISKISAKMNEIKRGEWKYNEGGGYVCSECDCWLEDYYGATPEMMNYCFGCGAKMNCKGSQK